MKIVSLVPSITELLFDLGLKNQLVGRTKFCVHPMPQVKEIQQVGGTKNLHLDKIIQLSPDLIIANKEENLKEEIAVLQHKFDVLVTEVSTFEDNFKMIEKIGLLTNSTPKATLLNQEIKNEFNQLKNFKTTPSVLYLIWNQPIMSIGKDTFIHEMLGLAGFENCCAKFERYPEITDKMELNPAYIFLSSEPFPFKEKHLEIIHAKFPKAKCVFVNGEMFSWYGSRMKFAPKYFSSLRDSLGLNN